MHCKFNTMTSCQSLSGRKVQTVAREWQALGNSETRLPKVKELARDLLTRYCRFRKQCSIARYAGKS